MTLDFENKDFFLNNSEFSQNVVIGKTGQEKTIKGIFDNEYYMVESGFVMNSTTSPVLTCKTSDVENLEQGTRVVIGGVKYEVVNHQPDGTGFSKLLLHKGE